MDIREIQNLIKFVAKSGASEVKLEMDDIKITIKTGGFDSEANVIHHQMPQQFAPQISPSSDVQTPIVQQLPSPVAVSEDSKYITIKSPMIGTLYRKPAPDKPLFVEVGQTISAGDVLCVIEAMKLFNEIESEFSGKIVKILVDDSTPVEYDQPLFLVDPS
jgi:acetyl-CoA carboxylase biotin carboxyl carrier protein